MLHSIKRYNNAIILNHTTMHYITSVMIQHTAPYHSILHHNIRRSQNALQYNILNDTNL